MGDQQQHTAGTWAVVDDKGDDYTVCAFDGDPRDGIMWDVICEVTSINDEADAHLLAAAPIMLVALKAFNMKPDQIVGAQGDYIILRLPLSAITGAAAAVAKAEGRS